MSDLTNKKDVSSAKGWELVNFCEVDKFAVKSYCAVHGEDESKNLGDITKVNESSLKPFNMICGGSPCFVEGTLVLTEDGYKPIESIRVGEKVLTHRNVFQSVLRTMVNETDELIGIYPSTSEYIFCTPSHPFYIRKSKNIYNNKRRTYDRIFEKPEWVNAKNIEVNDYIGVAINSESELPQWNGYDYYTNQYEKTLIHKNELSELFKSNDFWYIVGRYIGDGWLKTYDGKTVIICASDSEVNQVTDKLDRIGFNYCIVKERIVNKIQIVKKELYLFLEQFGHGAANKHLTKAILNLPILQMSGFLDGYVSSDGTYTQGKYKITSVSRRLIYEIGQCVAKAYKRPFSIYFTLRPKTCQIEGRVVNQKDTYQITWKFDDCIQDHAFYENGYIWTPITKILKEESHQLVYNLEVENDNSYVVQNVIAHNCQDFSLAGKQAGSKWQCVDCEYEYNPLTVHFSKRNQCPRCGSENLNKTRSSLLVEWLRIVRANKPIWGIYENVKNIVGKQFKTTFDMFITELQEYGYNCYWQVLNAKDYGIPQNRERVYLIIIQKEYDNGKFKFPEPFDNGKRLIDVLEDEVDEKYYVNTPNAQKLIEKLIIDGKLPDTQEVNNTVRGGQNESRSETHMGHDNYKQLASVSLLKQTYKNIDVAQTLMARDYKGLGNSQTQNGVINGKY